MQSAAQKEPLTASRFSGKVKLSPYGGLAQLVRAPASHAGGPRFEPAISHHFSRESIFAASYFHR